jgi:hypothetical protein
MSEGDVLAEIAQAGYDGAPAGQEAVVRRRKRLPSLPNTG